MLMLRPIRRAALAAAAASGAAGPAAAQALPPSGREARLYDVVIEAEAGIARFRFVSEALAAGEGHAAVAADFQWLCDNVALPEMAAEGWQVDEVVVSLADRPVPLGVMDPGAVQFFEGFGVATGTCIWEPW
jgi:hypothetical protein